MPAPRDELGASVTRLKVKFSHDLYYVKNANLFLNVFIFLQTIEVVIWGKAVSIAGALHLRSSLRAKKTYLKTQA